MILKENTFAIKKMKKLFWAAFFGWVINLLGSMGDGLIAGASLDADAVTAIELIAPIYDILYFFSLIISIGAAIMYSKELGAFRVEESEKIAGLGLIVSISMGVVLAGLMFIFKDSILDFYGCSGRITEYASEYFEAYIFIALFYPVMWFLYYMVNYDGDETIVFFVDISYTIVNLSFSMLLVGNMGIKGLAVGTLISEFVGFLILIPHFFKKSNSIHFKPFFSFKYLKEMALYSASTSSATLYIAIIDLVFNKYIIDNFSEDYIPAYTVVNAILNFAAMFNCAMDSGTVIVAVSNGENNPYAIRRVMKIVNRLAVVISLVFTGIMIYIAPYWPEIYGIEDEVIAQAAIEAGKIIPLSFIVTAFVLIYLSYYSTIEKPLEGNVISATYMLIGPIVLAIPLSKIWGMTGLFWGFALTPVFSILVLALVLWLKKDLKNAPYLLPETDEEEAHFDIYLDTNSIVELRDRVGDFLKEKNVESKIVNEVKLIIEDALVYTQGKNTKKVCCECTLLVSDKRIRLITKDNGVIFDMSQAADASLDLRCYILGRVMDQTSEKSYTTTISFNRNIYAWDR